MGGSVAQSVQRIIPGEEVLESITAVGACSLLVGSVSVVHIYIKKYNLSTTWIKMHIRI